MLATKLYRVSPRVNERLWMRLRLGKVGGHHFRRQQCIDRYIVDFYCPDAGLIVEIDNAANAGHSDAIRDRDLAARGFRVLHVRDAEIVENEDQVAAKIAAAMADAFAARHQGGATPHRIAS